MDRESPTTKKLTKEAAVAAKLAEEAEHAGLEIIGEGQNSKFRTYRYKSCGHEIEYAVRSVRDQTISCAQCIREKLSEEAASAGLEIIGPGRSSGYRIYRFLECGHEEEIGTRQVRSGKFRCNGCLAERLKREADELGLEIVGPGKRSGDRVYRRKACGHIQETSFARVRLGYYRCETCLSERYKSEADAAGLELIGTGSNSHRRLYRFLKCKHEQEFAKSAVRSGKIQCSACLAEKLSNEAASRDCEIIGNGKSLRHRLYLLPCGHEKEIEVAIMRDGQFECKICLEEKYCREAEAQNCKIVGQGKDWRYRVYELPCQHQQQLMTVAMRKGYFLCHSCEETSRVLPSNLYLLHIKLDSDEWLKLGYARFLDVRISQYGLPDSAEVTILEKLPFDTGNEAHTIEANIHSRHKRKRLHQKHMKQFHTRSGFEECYPVTMLDTLLDELEAVKQQRATEARS